MFTYKTNLYLVLCVFLLLSGHKALAQEPPSADPKKNAILDLLAESFDYVILIESDISNFHTTGDASPLGLDDRYENKIWWDRGISLYASGVFPSGYSLDVSFNSERDERNYLIFSNPDPDKYYPTYGDHSVKEYTANNTQDGLYFHLQKDKSYLHWGTFNTELTDTELAKHNRSFHGAKLNYDTKVLKAKAFLTQIKTLASHERFRSKAASLYYLNHKNILEGSEKIRIEVQDPITDIVSSRTDLSPSDYEIDYSQGRILLYKAVHSVLPAATIVKDELLGEDKVFIAVDYEYQPNLVDSIHHRSGGGQFTWNMLPGFFTAQGTLVNEELDEKHYTLRGLGGQVKLGRDLTFVGEFATSEQENTSNRVSDDGGLSFKNGALQEARYGRAYTLNGRWKYSRDLNLGLYYKDIDPGFSTTFLASTRGTRKFGGSMNIKLPQKASLDIRHDVTQLKDQSGLTPNAATPTARESTSTVKYTLPISGKVLTNTEFRHRDNGSPLNPDVLAPNEYILAHRITYDYRDDLKLHAGGQYAFSNSKDNTQGTFGADYRISPDTFLSVQEVIGHKGDATLLSVSNTTPEGDTQTMSFRMKPEPQIVLSSLNPISSTLNMRTEKSFSGDTSQNLYGLSKRFNDRMYMDFLYERSDRNFDDKHTAESAYSTAFIYTRKKLKMHLKGEYRTGSEAAEKNLDQLTIQSAFEYKAAKNMTLKGRGNASVSLVDIMGGERLAEFGEVGLGIAYRPMGSDRLNLLAQYKRIWDDGPRSQDPFSEQHLSITEVGSLEGILDLRFLQVTEKLAAKRVDEKVWLLPKLKTATYLWLSRVEVPLFKNFALSGEARYQYQDMDAVFQEQALLELDYQMGEDMIIGMGYNFLDYDGNFFEEEEGYTSKGWVFRVRAVY